MGYPMMQSDAFRKSSYSVSQGACVEVGSEFPGRVVMRDSKDIDGVTVSVCSNGWRQFISQVKLDGRGKR
jgi:hypothetical protein